MLENNNIIQTSLNFLVGTTKPKDTQDSVAALLKVPTGIETSLQNNDMDALRFAMKFVSNFLQSSREAIAEERNDVKKSSKSITEIVDGWGNVDLASGVVIAGKGEAKGAESSKTPTASESGERAVEEAVDNVREALDDQTKAIPAKKTEPTIAPVADEATKNNWDDLGAIEA